MRMLLITCLDMDVLTNFFPEVCRRLIFKFCSQNVVICISPLPILILSQITGGLFDVSMHRAEIIKADDNI